MKSLKYSNLTTGVLCGLFAFIAPLQSIQASPPITPEKPIIELNKKTHSQYSSVNNTNLSDAKKGFIAKPTGQILDKNNNVIWDFDSFDFLNDKSSPNSVHPNLWQQAQLNNQIGLFKVSDGIWQLRGFDLSNITLIEGKTGWIVVDALTSKETATVAIAFARKHLGQKPISAIIFTHSHVDHFGGALGLLSPEEIKNKKIPIIAPSGFMEEATSENLMVGPAMGRRAGYMYGKNLDRNEYALVDNGLGKAVSFGQVGILQPTLLISKPKESMQIDGLNFDFFNVPHSEAPAELTFYLPDLKAYCGAEILSHTLHNLYTLRGAKVRDTLKWVDYLDQSLDHAEKAEIFFAQHHWPVWGNKNIQQFIITQRDAYKYIHDQSVRMINAGYTSSEIAEKLKLPEELDKNLNIHGYYGTVKHNARAIYQFYMGWFDANPANLDQLPPKELAEGYINLAGGEKNALKNAQQAYDQGNYRWASEVLKQIIYVNPNNTEAKNLQAKTFSQLGYSSEASTWRNFYLTGAKELQQGLPKTGVSSIMLLDMLEHTPIERFLESMSASLNAEKAKDENIVVHFIFSDLNEKYRIEVKNSVMHFKKVDAVSKDSSTNLTLTKPFFLKMMTGQAGGLDLLLSKDTKVEGSKLGLRSFFGLFDKATGVFPIVTRHN